MGRAYGLARGTAILFAGLMALLFAAPLRAETGAGAGPGAAANTDQAAADVLCIVVPHFKDEYWLSVGYGLQQQAAEDKAVLRIFESGGYHALQRQIALLRLCRDQGSAAILFGAVSANDPQLLAVVHEVAATTPIVALVNALDSPDLAAAVGVDWRLMGQAVGRYLAQRHPAGTAPARIGLVTGPEVSGWSPLLETGLRTALGGTAVEIVALRHADTGLREQLREVEALLRGGIQLDYIVGSAPAIEGAMGLLPGAGDDPALIATYISHSVRRGLRNGRVVAAPFDDPVEQGRIGIRTALQVIEGRRFDHPLGPEIQLLQAPLQGPLELSPADLHLPIE